MPAPALRTGACVERVEHTLPPFIVAHQIDRAIEDDRWSKREQDAWTIPQGLAPENRAIPTAQCIRSIGTDIDVENITGSGG